MAHSPRCQVCERLSAAGVPPTHPVFRRAAAALREAAEREPDVEVVRAALTAASRVEAATYLGRGDIPLRPMYSSLCTPTMYSSLYTTYDSLTAAYCRGDVSLRPSVWLWRRAIKLRKTEAPATLCAECCNPRCYRDARGCRPRCSHLTLDSLEAATLCVRRLQCLVSGASATFERLRPHSTRRQQRARATRALMLTAEGAVPW